MSSKSGKEREESPNGKTEGLRWCCNIERHSSRSRMVKQRFQSNALRSRSNWSMRAPPFGNNLLDQDLFWVLTLKGLSENKYLQFGAIWRDFGARDKNASCRKMDQFIFFEDIHEFAVQLCRTWGVPVPDFGTFLTKWYVN